MKQYNNQTKTPGAINTIICFSHLRWDFVYQRPQHILSRMAKDTVVYFIEEPVFTGTQIRYLSEEKASGLTVLRPQLPEGTSAERSIELQKMLLDELVQSIDIGSAALWYYTPMAQLFSRHLHTALTVFDCMDELAAFAFAPKELLRLEEELLQKADIVFTGGASLYEAKKHRHKNIHKFPSSIDYAHFAQARGPLQTPDEQQGLPHPRLGFFGVIDERFDIALIDSIATLRPQWQIILVGPVVKIDPATLPKHPNITYTGGKTYDELPAYLAGWDIAMIPFALNESTRYISPTKTPEYLAAGKPVISAPIKDVEALYGKEGLVQIARTPEEWITAAEYLMAADTEQQKRWLTSVDTFLQGHSWDETVRAMKDLLDQTLWQKSDAWQAKQTGKVSLPA